MWKCQTIESTDWNSRENAKMWPKDLADTINAANEQLGIAVHWEHRPMPSAIINGTVIGPVVTPPASKKP